MSRSRKPQALSSLIDGVVDHLGVRNRLDDVRVETVWREIAGSQLDRVMGRVWLKGDRLFVQVTSAEWRHELHLQRVAWCSRLNDELGEMRVKEIVFR